jgi:hypothetical protein
VEAGEKHANADGQTVWDVAILPIWKLQALPDKEDAHAADLSD